MYKISVHIPNCNTHNYLFQWVITVKLSLCYKNGLEVEL